jgi:CheY-like chemotaxis protein
MTVVSRVLLLEDDASIRRFVALALADLPIELIEAASIADARQVLAQQPVDLFISDLMLPDGHAMDMFRTVGDPAMRIVIFSAGISAATRERAAELRVFRVLDKPVPYPELIACVEQALAMPAAEAPALPLSSGADRLPAMQRQRAIDAHFGGQAALFDEFLASCLAQLPADLEAGDRACVGSSKARPQAASSRHWRSHGPRCARTSAPSAGLVPERWRVARPGRFQRAGDIGVTSRAARASGSSRISCWPSTVPSPITWSIASWTKPSRGGGWICEGASVAMPRTSSTSTPITRCASLSTTTAMAASAGSPATPSRARRSRTGTHTPPSVGTLGVSPDTPCRATRSPSCSS